MSRRSKAGVITLLLAAMTALAMAPLLMPDSYSVVRHSVSESAAQGVDGAWLARLGFLLFGFAALFLAVGHGSRWDGMGRLAHAGFGVSIIAAAAFSHGPWDGSAFDEFEDLLHFTASFGVGLFFTVGLVLVAVRRTHPPGWLRVVDGVALVAALVIPLVMANVSASGLVQRVMFIVVFLWYGLETMRARGDDVGGGATLSTDAAQVNRNN
ncbi:MAG TPA: DUF998 domain-containing protein [Acidimicrobiia bacterium]|nr:DUF998 domain-containing protein [Acidimicrobiia bacterium]